VLYLGEVDLSQDPRGRLLVLVLLHHVLQRRFMAAQLRLDFLSNAQTHIIKIKDPL